MTMDLHRFVVWVDMDKTSIAQFSHEVEKVTGLISYRPVDEDLGS